jgi:uncharacterized protein YbaR (Trm112 family)
MPFDSTRADLNALNAWAEQFACPACGGILQFKDMHFTCPGCGRDYPIDDGIPVLIKDRATLPAGPG